MYIMSKKSILGMPPKYFYTVCAFLVIGIIIGSFCDFNISKTLSNQTAVGDFFQHYGNIVSHFMYPIAGICIFKGIRRKGKRFHLLSNGVLVFSLFWTFYSFLDTGGKYLREDYGYVAGESSAFPLALTCLTWLALIALVTFIAYKIIDDKEADRLIAIGSVIWILLLGYNRIHMNAHFLTDVCFGVLITYSIYALTYRFVFSALSPVPVDTESAE